MVGAASVQRPGQVDRWMLPGDLARVGDPGPSRGRRTARDWAVDVAMTGLAVFFAVETAAAMLLPDVLGLPSWLRVVDPVLGGLAVLAIWWRRRFPVATGALAAVALALSNTSTGAAALLLFSLALHRGWRWAVPITAAAVLLGLPYIYLYFPAIVGPPEPTVVAIVFGAALVVASGLGVRARRQLVLTLRRRAEDQRRAHEKALRDARYAERQRIAREMHDVLAHRLSLLSVHAGALEFRTRPAPDAATAPPSATEVRDAATVVATNAHLALTELRDVLCLLGTGSATVAPQPGLAEVPALVEEARGGGQTVRYGVGAGLTALPGRVQRSAYRVVQEGLTNARKHASGATVTVAVREVAGELLVEVANPVPVGVTAAEIPGAGVGLTGLAERVDLDGGRLDHGVTDGTFRLTARLPLTAGAQR